MADLSKIKEVYMEAEGNEQLEFHQYYEAVESVVPVLNKTNTSGLGGEPTKQHFNFMKDVVNRKVGYMSGIEFSINSELIESDDRLTNIKLELKKMSRETSFDISNTDSLKRSSVSGLSHRLCYTDDEGKFNFKNLDAWQVVYDYSNDNYKPTTANYYFDVIDIEGEVSQYCHVYDNEFVYYFKTSSSDETPKSGKSNSSKTPEVVEYVEYIPEGMSDVFSKHNFSQVPVIPLLNNGDSKSDFIDSRSLNNTYDDVLSESVDDLSISGSMLKIVGALEEGVDTVDSIEDRKAFLIPLTSDGKPGGDVAFIDKNINDTAIQNTLNTLRDSIYELAGSVDLQTLSENSNARIFTIRTALMRLENTANVTERFFRKALEKQLELWIEIINKTTSLNISEMDFDIIFKRNFVQDKELQARQLQTLMTTTSTLDAYIQSELFDDPQGAYDRYIEEQKNGIAFE